MDTYQTGTGTQDINLTVDITTIGFAATRAITIDLSSDAPGIPVGNSGDASGDINDKPIGSASSLAGRRLSVLTRIDLFGSLEERKAEFERIVANYKLENGEEGDKVFDDPIKTAHNSFN